MLSRSGFSRRHEHKRFSHVLAHHFHPAQYMRAFVVGVTAAQADELVVNDVSLWHDQALLHDLAERLALHADDEEHALIAPAPEQATVVAATASTWCPG